MSRFAKQLNWVAAGLLGLAALASGSARAADLPSRALEPLPPVYALGPKPYYVRLGVTGVFPDVSSSMAIGGTPVVGGGVSIAPRPAVMFEAGYYFTPNIAASLSGGFPPTFVTKGTGTLASSGVLYRAMVGLPVFAVTYHLDMFGRFRPYAGAGVGYAIVFRNESAAITDPLSRNEAAFVLVGGADYAITQHWGVFVDVKKAFLKQPFTGTAHVPVAPNVVVPLPATASVRTDPLLATIGISYRF